MNPYIERCFQLAEQGRGLTGSNPLVGALLVYDGRIISEGYHRQYGGPHAEVECLREITDKAILENSTLYISLEPCNYQGKTPPCTDLILNKGIKKVVVGSADFNPKVRMQGIDYLRSQEIEVINLNLEEKQKLLNISFFINQTKNEPYFIGKLAFSSDKIIGRTGETIKITSPEIDVLSHRLRAECDAILVGKNTWQNDQPQLNIRHYYSQKQPDIILLASDTTELSLQDLKRKIAVINDSKNPQTLAKTLFELGYQKILVEGGAEVFRFFEQNRLFHEIYTLENQNLILVNGITAPPINTQNYIVQQRKTIKHQTITYYQRNDLLSS